MINKKYPDVVMPEYAAEKILEGQKALVTGGASGIGRAGAIALGKAGPRCGWPPTRAKFR